MIGRKEEGLRACFRSISFAGSGKRGVSEIIFRFSRARAPECTIERRESHLRYRSSASTAMFFPISCCLAACAVFA